MEEADDQPMFKSIVINQKLNIYDLVNPNPKHITYEEIWEQRPTIQAPVKVAPSEIQPSSTQSICKLNYEYTCVYIYIT